MVVLLWALIVASVDLAFLLARDDVPRRVAPPEAAAPASAPRQDRVALPSEPAPATPAEPTASSAAVGAGVNVPPPAPPDPTSPATSTDQQPVPVSVTCQNDLDVAESPDVPYNFLCTADGVAVTWPSEQLTFVASGLNVLQRSALDVALSQWQREAGFTMTEVASAAAADVVISSADLDNDEGGYAQVHYTCTTACLFDHADVQLSSTLSLDNALWVATILHELGHVAGLSHVSRESEVMYPIITVTTRTTYGSGDLAGLHELTRVRTATAP